MRNELVYSRELAPEFPTPARLRLPLPDLLFARSFSPLFCLYLFIVVVLPSGSIYGINFKLVLYAWLLPSALYTFLRQPGTRLTEVLMLFAIPAVLLAWVVEAQVYEFPMASSLRQYTDILLTLLTCWLAVILCRSRVDGAARLVRVVIAAEAVAALLKLGIVSYALLRGVPVTSIVENIDRAFGVDLMTMDLGALLGRIQFVSDGLIPICIFAVVYFRQRLRLGAWSSLLAASLLSFSVILSFSRYLWVFSCVALVIGLVLGKKDKVYAILASALVALTLVSLPLLKNLYQVRFSEQVAGESDIARVEQTAALKSFFLDAPILGHGLGSYTPQVIRADTEAKYSYEVQLLALLGQMGMAGALFFVSLCMYYFGSLWPRTGSQLPEKAALFLLLLGWLASGLFNPLLINPVGAISYAAIMSMGKLSESPSKLSCSYHVPNLIH